MPMSSPPTACQRRDNKEGIQTDFKHLRPAPAVNTQPQETDLWSAERNTALPHTQCSLPGTPGPSSPKNLAENTVGANVSKPKPRPFKPSRYHLLAYKIATCFLSGIREPQSSGCMAPKAAHGIPQYPIQHGSWAWRLGRWHQGSPKPLENYYSFLNDHCFYSTGKWVRTLCITHGPEPLESAQSLRGASCSLCSQDFRQLVQVGWCFFLSFF